MTNKTRSVQIALLLALAPAAHARDFYVDSRSGNDANNGLSEGKAWRSLAKANAVAFEPGDRLLLKRGSRFAGGLKLDLTGTAEQPIAIEAYGDGPVPVIDAKGHLAGVHLRNSRHVAVRDLEITADGGKTIDGSKPHLRYGVYVQGDKDLTSDVLLEGLTIYKIYPEVGSPHEGRNPTTHLGTAIAIVGNPKKPCARFTVRNCRMAQVGFKAIDLKHVQHVELLDNRMKEIGGPAIQPGNVDDLVVRGNVVDGSGSRLDPRMHARGSGIWPWTCNRVLIEKNTFMHARGKGDSCGIHIDFNCRDVVVQYNLSIDNEGGFVEILGDNHNCAYRYNISVNDGARVQGEDGAHQEGKVLWTSGFVGKKDKSGPFNSYIYNNTIYVGPKSRSCFSIGPTTEGLLIANNIFHIMGETLDVLGDQDKRIEKRRDGPLPRTFFANNLYLHPAVLPAALSIQDSNMLTGDPKFAKPGGMRAEDYAPGNAALVMDRGIPIPRLDGDEVGLAIGLAVEHDFFGNPIVGNPDLGAIEISR